MWFTQLLMMQFKGQSTYKSFNHEWSFFLEKGFCSKTSRNIDVRCQELVLAFQQSNTQRHDA